jgi:RND family efflux transporter MFP subunit
MHRAWNRSWLTFGAPLLAPLLLLGCDEPNRYVPPPPPEVVVANPVRKNVIAYLQETGTLAAVNTVDLVARVPGFVQAVQYQDGAVVKKGAPLFVIEPEPYRVKLEQAKAAQDGAEAALKQSQAEFERQADLISRQVSTQANYDKALAQRDSDKASLEQAQANTQLAKINLDYTQVLAPFDGVVSARVVSVGEYVGANNTPTKLATIVQVDPIYVNFNVSEQDVLRIRAARMERGMNDSEIKKLPVEVGLQTETGYPHVGHLDYVAPTIAAGTGTLAVRGVLDNPKAVLLPGYFVRVRVPGPGQEQLLVPDSALGSDQGGRYVLVLGSDNVVQQRPVTPGQRDGSLRVIDKGLTPDDRVVVDGLMRAIPGQKVDPRQQPAAAAQAK